MKTKLTNFEMEKWLLVLFLLINVVHRVLGTQVSRKRFVEEPITVHVSVCVDKISNCAVYTFSVCTNHEYWKWVIDNCAGYCKICHGTIGKRGIGSSGTRSLGHASLDIFHGISGCFYKNQIYQEGTSWNDGCNYSCRCLDGKSGLYHCKRTICTAVKSAHLAKEKFGPEKKLLHNILARQNQRQLSP